MTHTWQGREVLKVAYRADGWPLCPRCGEDELFSMQFPAKASDPLACYRCDWAGHVPLKAEADRAKVLTEWVAQRRTKPPTR